MFDSPFVSLSNPTHLLSLSLVKWILDYLPTLLTHHLEAEATLRNNPRENHISFHIKDVFDSVKSDSNSGSVPSQVRLWMWTRNKEYNAKPRKETENEKESRNNKRNKPLLKLALSPPSLASRPHQQLGLGGLVKKPFSYLFTFFVRKDQIRAKSKTKTKLKLN